MTIRVTTLDNGMRVATDDMPGVESVTLGLWVGVGTRHEDAAVNGVAHMLEHMVFKGTATRSARAIAEAIENVGGHINAYTTREHTAFYAKVLKADCALAIDVLADILQRSVFDEDELARERHVIIQEIGQAIDTPDDIVFDLFQERAYPGQPLGRPVLGTADIVARLGREDLIAYQERLYGPGSMIAVAAGRIDHDWFVDRIASAFARPAGPETSALAPASYRGGVLLEPRALEQVHVTLGFPGVATLDPDYYALGLMSTLLGGGMSSRLFQEVRERRGLAYTVYSFAAHYDDSGLFGIYAGTGGDEVVALLPVLAEQLEQVASGVEPAELERARAQLKASLLMARESSSSRAETLAQHLLSHNRAVPVAEIVAALDAVGVADISRVTSALLDAAPTVVALGPIGDPQPYERLVERLAGHNSP